MLRGLGSAILTLALVVLSACTEKSNTPVYFADENPPLLSSWAAIVADDQTLSLGDGVVPYALNTPLFTDYAHKLRTVWNAAGRATVPDEGVLDFPVGTVITKTFYYPHSDEVVHKADDREAVNGSRGLDLRSHRLIETRLLVRRDDGWHPLSYVWNDDQTDAHLKRAGAVIPLTLASDEGAQDFAYIVPNENQCASCHAADATTKVIHPLGPTAGQLNSPYAYAGGTDNQLARWSKLGLVEDSVSMDAYLPDWDDPSVALDDRARAYLSANCAHCHNPRGPADTSGLDLTMEATGTAVGLCKPPIAAGSGTGGRRFAIVPGAPEQSILTYRMASANPGAMMPELGRSLTHDEGVALMEEWISQMPGGCS